VVYLMRLDSVSVSWVLQKSSTSFSSAGPTISNICWPLRNVLIQAPKIYKPLVGLCQTLPTYMLLVEMIVLKSGRSIVMIRHRLNTIIGLKGPIGPIGPIGPSRRKKVMMDDTSLILSEIKTELITIWIISASILFNFMFYFIHTQRMLMQYF